MPSTSIICGILLILIGVAGYISGVMNDRTSLTALIPAAFGALLALFGFIAQSKESLRKHLMHAAVVVALLGFIAVAARLVPKLGSLDLSAAVIAQIAMGVVCLIFVVLAIKSFAAARRNG
jgi:ribose/xylose/arabinose/galactoside ABC-type transport system permease subunit